MKKSVILLGMILLMMATACGCAEKDNSDEKKSTKSTETVETESNNKEEKIIEENEKEQKEQKSASKKKTSSSEVAKEAEEDLAAYKAPAEAVKIDLNEEDPSNDKIQFKYDKDGRVSNCSYYIGKQLIYVSYQYSDNNAQIYAFSEDGTLLADKTVTLSDFDPEKGFAKIDGYYFKGYTKAN